MGNALMMYGQDWDEHLPRVRALPLDPEGQQDSIVWVLRPYVKEGRIFICPSAVAGLPGRDFGVPTLPGDPAQWRLTYWCFGYDFPANAGFSFPPGSANYWLNNILDGRSMAAIDSPADRPVVIDQRIELPGGRARFAHAGGATHLFADGHVKWRKRAEADE